MDLRAEQNMNGTVYLELSSPSTELQKIIGNDGESRNGPCARAIAPGHPKFRPWNILFLACAVFSDASLLVQATIVHRLWKERPK
jgi:hypothetical protein